MKLLMSASNSTRCHRAVKSASKRGSMTTSSVKYRVHSQLECSSFVLNQEVAMIDRLLSAEMNALFER